MAKLCLSVALSIRPSAYFIPEYTWPIAMTFESVYFKTTGVHETYFWEKKKTSKHLFILRLIYFPQE
jgi:hypothetical protein